MAGQSHRALGLIIVVLFALALVFDSPPARGASMSWSPPTQVDPVGRFTGYGAGLTAISCPSITLCVAVDEVGNAVTSSDPVSGAHAWHLAAIDSGHDLTGVSCPSVSLCVATDANGAAFSSTDPTAGPSAWTAAATGAPYLSGVSCATPSLCVAVGGQAIHVTVDLGAGSAGWTATAVGTSSSVAASLAGVSCPSPSLCVAVEYDGDVLSSTDPTAGAGSWRSAAVDRGMRLCGVGFQCPDGFMSVSCASTALCVAGDDAERPAQTFASADPAGGGSTWSVQPWTGYGYVAAISCPSVSLCAIVGGQDAGVSSRPASGWSTQKIDQSPYLLLSISCAAAWMCVAGDMNGQVVVGLAAPELTGVTQSHREWSETRKAGRRGRGGKMPVGTVFRFALNEPAIVDMTFRREIPVSIRGRCASARRRAAIRGRCDVQLNEGTVQILAGQGMNQYPFRGHLRASKVFPPGTYALTLNAKNAGGGRATPRTLRFTIAR